MKAQNRQYNYLINGNRVEIKKEYRTKTQFEYYLTIFMGDSDYESILMYQGLWLTKRSALNEAKRAIFSSKKPRLERIV